MPHRAAPIVLALALALALVTGGCFDLESPETVKDFRVLAICADAPEVMVRITPGTKASGTLYQVSGDPAPVTLRVLAVNPEAPDTPLTYTVDACVQNALLRCDVEDAGPVLPVVTDGRGQPDTLTFVFAPTAAHLNAWLKADPYQGYGGLFVMLHLKITQAGSPTVNAAKLVTYNVPFVPRGEDQDPPPPKRPNANPVLDGLKIDDVESVDPGAPVTLRPGKEVTIEPMIDLDVAEEMYPVVTFPGRSGEPPAYRVLTERLQFEAYVTAGELSGSVQESRSPAGPNKNIEARLTAPDDPKTPEITLWMVTRDDRGGCSWTRRTLKTR